MVRKKNALINAAMEESQVPVKSLNDQRDREWLNSFDAEADPDRALRRGYWQSIDGHLRRQHQAYPAARQEIAVEFEHGVPTPCTGLPWSCSLYCHETCQKTVLEPVGLCLDRYRGLVENPMNRKHYEYNRARPPAERALGELYVREILKLHTCMREVDVPPEMVPAALENGDMRRIVVSALGLPKQVPLFTQSPFADSIDFSTWSVVDPAPPVKAERVDRRSEADLCAAAVSALDSVRAAKTNNANVVVAVNLVPRRVSYGDRRGPGDMAVRVGANVIFDFGGHEDSDRVMQFIAAAPEILFPRKRVSFVRHLFVKVSQALEGRWLRFFLNMHAKPLDVYVFGDEVHAGGSTYAKDLLREFNTFCRHPAHRMHLVDPVKQDDLVGASMAVVPALRSEHFVDEDVTSLELTFAEAHDAEADVRREVQAVSMTGTFLKTGLEGKVSFKTSGPQEVMSAYDFEMWCIAATTGERDVKHLVVRHCYHPDFILEVWRLLKHLDTVEHLTLVFNEWPALVTWEGEFNKAFAGGELLIESLTCLDVVFECDSEKISSDGGGCLFMLWDAMLHACPRLTCLGTNLYLSSEVDIATCALLQSMPRPYRCDCDHADRLVGRTYFKHEQFMYQCEWVEQDAVYTRLFTQNQMRVLEKVSLFPISNDTVGDAASDSKFPAYRAKNKIASPCAVAATVACRIMATETELVESEVSFTYHEGYCEKDNDSSVRSGVFY